MLQIEGLGDDEVDEEPASWPDEMTDAPVTLTITQLTSGVRDKNRVNVFVNGKFTLSLDVKQVVDLQVKVGKVLTEDELQELHKASEFGKLYQKSLEWAFTRPHSIWETRDYLKRRQLKRLQTNRQRIKQELKPYPEIQDAAIDLVMERLAERGYIDDKKFAEYYVENRFIKKGISKRRLEIELRKKGVADDIIEAALNTTTRKEEDELAKMIAKKRRKYDSRKLIEYLIQQGFDYRMVKEAVAKSEEEERGW